MHTWPAQEVVRLAGWEMRFSSGFGHRPNSVAALAFDGSDVEKAVVAVETQYRRRGLRPMFHVSPAVAPAGLPELLQRQGYQPITRSLVCVAETGDVRERCAAFAAGQLRLGSDPDFDQLVVSGSHSAADGHERLAVLGRIDLPVIRATVAIDGKGVACGMGVAYGGMVGINLMRTHPAFRRRGCAGQILGTIAAWALQQMAQTLFLNVEQDNIAARSLYERVGFTTAYSYYYLVKD